MRALIERNITRAFGKSQLETHNRVRNLAVRNLAYRKGQSVCNIAGMWCGWITNTCKKRWGRVCNIWDECVLCSSLMLRLSLSKRSYEHFSKVKVKTRKYAGSGGATAAADFWIFHLSISSSSIKFITVPRWLKKYFQSESNQFQQSGLQIISPSWLHTWRVRTKYQRHTTA